MVLNTRSRPAVLKAVTDITKGPFNIVVKAKNTKLAETQFPHSDAEGNNEYRIVAQHFPYYCYGFASTDTGSVCSAKGDCTAENTCTCSSGYTGSTCNLKVCYTIPENQPNVCSGHGSCTEPNSCSCNTGYDGSECQYPMCFGLASSNAKVCSGNGTCIGMWGLLNLFLRCRYLFVLQMLHRKQLPWCKLW